MEQGYKHYDYAHYRLGSKPVITTETIDNQIAGILNFLNDNPDLNMEQLKFLESKIKEKIQEKEEKYLIPIENTHPTSRKIGFVQGTKLGGKKKRTRKNRYKRRKN
jgi:uncharacterized protein YllA (UPF0747 family)